MKQVTTIVLVLVMALSMFTGCRSRQEDKNGTTNTTATQNDMMPDTGNILPDHNDTVDPTNGANQDDANPTVDDNIDPTMDTAIGNGDITDSTTGTESRSRNRSHPMH